MKDSNPGQGDARRGVEAMPRRQHLAHRPALLAGLPPQVLETCGGGGVRGGGGALLQHQAVETALETVQAALAVQRLLVWWQIADKLLEYWFLLVDRESLGAVEVLVCLAGSLRPKQRVQLFVGRNQR